VEKGVGATFGGHARVCPTGEVSNINLFFKKKNKRITKQTKNNH